MLPKFLLLFAAVFTAACCAKVLQVEADSSDRLSSVAVDLDVKAGFRHHERLPRMRTTTTGRSRPNEHTDNLIEERSGTDRGADPGLGLHAELDNNDESAEFELEESAFDDDLAGAGMPREEHEFDDESESLYIAELAKKFQIPPHHVWLICRVMERIQQIFRSRLPANSGNQFAVMAIIPQSVVNQAQRNNPQHTNNQIDALMAEQHADVNYRFTRPTHFPHEECRRHAERVALRGRPNERNFNLQQFYNSFVAANPGDAPAFVVIYTWIFPCRYCARGIIGHFGAAHGDNPAFNIPTYVGRTSAGNYIHPPLNDEIRTSITNLLLLHLIRLFYIREVPYKPNGVALEEHDDLDLALMEANGDNDLCDDCYINSYLLKNTYNCDTGGKSTPENPTCAINGLRSAEQINGTSVELRQSDPCCSPASTTGLFTAAQGQKCRSDSPCAFGDNTYPQCKLEGFFGSIEYCCTGECGNHGNTDYDWCESGSEYQVCATRGHIAGRSRTAKGEKCRSDHQCGYHGKNYAWCYKEDGEEDYCCASECSNHGGEKYDWCTVGAITLRQRCQRENIGSYSKDGLKCDGGSAPCGFHYGKSYAWCFLEQGGSGPCCTTACSPKGSTYDWCTSGEHWFFCKVREFPTPGHTYKLEKCKDSHPCGYYGERFAWCYTESGSPNWDYCCTQECGLNGEKYDWCTIG